MSIFSIGCSFICYTVSASTIPYPWPPLPRPLSPGPESKALRGETAPLPSYAIGKGHSASCHIHGDGILQSADLEQPKWGQVLRCAHDARVLEMR